MLDAHADTRQDTVVPFLTQGQFLTTRLFFGW